MACLATKADIAGLRSTVSGVGNDVAGIKAKVTGIEGDVGAIVSKQNAGGDINDTWTVRILSVGIIASACVYPLIIRPIRIAKEKRRQLGAK